MQLNKILYEDLNARQKENYNFQKIAADLAEYGFSCMWLNDDWQGADFIANHIGGTEFLKVQLKGRVMVARKYIDKDIYIAFHYNETSYLYPHDEILEKILPSIKETASWREAGAYSWNNPVSPRVSKLLNLESYII